tara:strand:+ start:12 stop:134 length:123 start_codon:yes stop_codon:yes gene_type:complete
MTDLSSLSSGNARGPTLPQLQSKSENKIRNKNLLIINIFL